MATLRDQLQASLGGAYTLERELGGGGMSRVFVAQDTVLHRLVVVKVLPPDLAAGVNVERFAREIRLAARLQHPHIVAVHSAGAAGGGLPYYTMPFVDGETLRQRLARDGALPVAEAVRLLREVADALAYAHRQGVAHRDVKPANILLSAGHALVADFGVAKALGASTKTGGGGHTTPTDSQITVPGFALGTPAYMAPEQALGDPAADHRVDIYALGVVAYEALSGRVPFSATTLQALLAAHVAETPPPIKSLRPEVPPALAALAMRCLAKDPRDRPQRADDVVAALDAIASGSSAVVTPGRARRSRGALIAGLAVGVVALAAGGLYVARTQRGGVATAAAAGGAGGSSDSPAPAYASVAVLPLVNVGGDTAEEYFADGMTDELASELGKVEGLRVAARGSSFAFKGEAVNPRDVGAKLGVAAVLEGSVRRDGSKVRVNAELTSTRDGLTLWSDRYERELKDVFAVQDDITAAIVGALRLRLAGAGGAPVARHGTANVEAHDLYLKGLYFYNKFTEPDLRRSLDYFAWAIAKDSTYAPALAQAAIAWTDLADDWVAPHDAYPKARAAALRALALDPTSAEAHAAYGVELLWYERDLPAAGREMRRAIQLNPSSAPAYFAYSAYLAVTGQRDSSVAATRRAQRLDPLAPMLPARNAFAMASLGRVDDALAEGRKALELDAHFNLAHIAVGDALAAKGDYARALREYRAAEGLEAITQARVARAQVALGERDSARVTLARLERAARGRYIRPEEIASVFLSLGPRDSVFAWLDRAVAARSNGVMLLAVERRWDPVRDDPRFAEILEEVGLPH